MFSSLIELCRDRETRLAAESPRSAWIEIPSNPYQQMVALLSQTGTWDRLHLHGTKVVMGDVRKLEVGRKSYSRRELEELSADLPLRLQWTRGRALGLAKAMTGRGARVPLPGPDSHGGLARRYRVVPRGRRAGTGIP